MNYPLLPNIIDISYHQKRENHTLILENQLCKYKDISMIRDLVTNNILESLWFYLLFPIIQNILTVGRIFNCANFEMKIRLRYANQ